MIFLISSCEPLPLTQIRCTLLCCSDNELTHVKISQNAAQRSMLNCWIRRTSNFHSIIHVHRMYFLFCPPFIRSDCVFLLVFPISWCPLGFFWNASFGSSLLSILLKVVSTLLYLVFLLFNCIYFFSYFFVFFWGYWGHWKLFSCVWSGRGVKLTTYFHLVSILKNA